jgi:hypothetical protein
MLQLSCNLYSGGKVVVTDLKVWVHIGQGKEQGGFFHVLSDLEFLSGAKYRLELLGEKGKLLGMPGGHWMDVVITGVSGHIAYFAPASLSGAPLHRQ